MGMGVDERRHDHAALGVNELGVRIFGLQIGSLADFLDLRSVDDNAAVGQIAIGGVSGDQLTVCENVHDVDLLRCVKKTKMGMQNPSSTSPLKQP